MDRNSFVSFLGVSALILAVSTAVRAQGTVLRG
jgi:hypothetical protein